MEDHMIIAYILTVSERATDGQTDLS